MKSLKSILYWTIIAATIFLVGYLSNIAFGFVAIEDMKGFYVHVTSNPDPIVIMKLSDYKQENSENGFDIPKISMAVAVADWYGLNQDQVILLLAIMDHECGEKAWKEFGIEHKEKISDPKRRFCDHACWASGVIKKFCPEVTVDSIKRLNHGFGEGKRRYPGFAEDPDWWIGIRIQMDRYRKFVQ